MDISKNQWRSTGGKGELGQALVPTPTLETNKQIQTSNDKYFHICKWIFVAISNFSKIDEIISEVTALILKDHISSLLSAIYFWSIWTILETRQTVSNFLLRLIIWIGWIGCFITWHFGTDFSSLLIGLDDPRDATNGFQLLTKVSALVLWTVCTCACG